MCIMSVLKLLLWLKAKSYSLSFRKITFQNTEAHKSVRPNGWNTPKSGAADITILRTENRSH